MVYTIYSIHVSYVIVFTVTDTRAGEARQGGSYETGRGSAEANHHCREKKRLLRIHSSGQDDFPLIPGFYLIILVGLGSSFNNICIHKSSNLFS